MRKAVDEFVKPFTTCTVKGIVAPGVGYDTVVDFPSDRLGARTVTEAAWVPESCAKPNVGPDEGAGASVVHEASASPQYEPIVFVSVSPGLTGPPPW